jgi:hypothetical protein
MPNMYMILCRNMTTAACVMFTTGITCIHLVNVLIAMNKNLNPPDTLGKMPTMSIPHIAKGQERLKNQRGFACYVVFF